jgi:hypothetical protein
MWERRARQESFARLYMSVGGDLEKVFYFCFVYVGTSSAAGVLCSALDECRGETWRRSLVCVYILLRLNPTSMSICLKSNNIIKIFFFVYMPQIYVYMPQ